MEILVPTTEPADSSKILLTVGEAAVLMGLGRAYVYRLVMHGELASLKIGRNRRVPHWAQHAFIQEQMNPYGTGS
jgi:excisionase family DNA binding protein